MTLDGAGVGGDVAAAGDGEVERAVGGAGAFTLEEVVANDEDVSRAQVLSLSASEDDAIGERLVSNAPDPQMMLEHRERLTYQSTFTHEGKTHDAGRAMTRQLSVFACSVPTDMRKGFDGAPEMATGNAARAA